jgi:metallophosphoesterase superfamily enzyme
VQRARLQLHPGLYLDARRAVWFETEGALAVADLHLGYSWAQRARGGLFPVEPVDDAITRLVALARDYRPREVIILGDILHSAAALDPVRHELRRLCDELAAVCTLRLLAGNHDRGLLDLLAGCNIDLPVEAKAVVGPHLLCHGDRADAVPTGFSPLLTFIGHEHPASVKCPCFLAGPEMVILPAFSAWAAGTNIRSGPFHSPLAQTANFTHAFAIMAGKLLPIPL